MALTRGAQTFARVTLFHVVLRQEQTSKETFAARMRTMPALRQFARSSSLRLDN